MTVGTVKSFFVIGVIFLFAFNNRGFFTSTTTAGTLFFRVDFVFRLFRKFIAGQVIVVGVSWLGFFFLRPTLAVFFGQFACCFSLLSRFFFQLT